MCFFDFKIIQGQKNLGVGNVANARLLGYIIED